MPKVKRQRTKYHYSKSDDGVEDIDAPMDYGLADLMSELNKEEGQGSDVTVEAKKEADVKDEVVVGKKNKRMNRRNQWLKKLGAIHSNQLEQKAAAKRRKTVVVGDVRPLQDALDEVAQIFTDPGTTKEKAEKNLQRQAKVVSRNKRQMVLADECKRFQAVLGNQQFKTDPLKAISRCLQSNMTTSS
ncbi:ribosome biogenesis protein SLX9 homolog [Sycon ciliatum]|uniref:ribosome biogenesis protein SLX9 homolog n=1 Tax=Sycon ciliatum TaxID=27933 RepID=UPI0031F663FE